MAPSTSPVPALRAAQHSRPIRSEPGAGGPQPACNTNRRPGAGACTFAALVPPATTCLCLPLVQLGKAVCTKISHWMWLERKNAVARALLPRGLAPLWPLAAPVACPSLQLWKSKYSRRRVVSLAVPRVPHAGCQPHRLPAQLGRRRCRGLPPRQAVAHNLHCLTGAQHLLARGQGRAPWGCTGASQLAQVAWHQARAPFRKEVPRPRRRSPTPSPRAPPPTRHRWPRSGTRAPASAGGTAL